MNTAILNGLLSSAKLLPRCYGVSGLHVANIIAPIAHSWLSVQHLTRFVQHHLSTSCIPSSLRSFQSWPLNKHCRLSTGENSFAAQHSSPKSPRSVEKYDCSCREFFGGWKTTAGLNLDPGPCRGNVPSFWKGSCFQGGEVAAVCMWVKLTELHVWWKCVRDRRSQLGGCLKYVHKIRCTHWIQIISGEKGLTQQDFSQQTEPQSWAETVESMAQLRLRASRYYRKWPKSLDGSHGSSFPTFVNMDLRTLAWPQLLSFIISSVFTSEPGTSAFSFFPLRRLPAAQNQWRESI